MNAIFNPDLPAFSIYRRKHFKQESCRTTHPSRRFEHFGAQQFPAATSRSKVRNTQQSSHLQSTLTRDNYLRIVPILTALLPTAQCLNSSRCLITGPLTVR